MDVPCSKILATCVVPSESVQGGRFWTVIGFVKLRPPSIEIAIRMAAVRCTGSIRRQATYTHPVSGWMAITLPWSTFVPSVIRTGCNSSRRSWSSG